MLIRTMKGKVRQTQWVLGGARSPYSHASRQKGQVCGGVINHYYPYGLRNNSLDGHPEDYKNMYTSKELQTGEFDPTKSTGLEMPAPSGHATELDIELPTCCVTFTGYDFIRACPLSAVLMRPLRLVHARFYDPQLGRWFTPDPATDRESVWTEQFSNPYLAMGNNPATGRESVWMMYVDPDGEFAIIAGLIIAKKVAAKVVIGAKVAGAYAKAGMKIAGTVGKFAGQKAGAAAMKTATKPAIKAGLKSGTINTISNYNADEGFGWHTLGDFAAGYAGGSFGVGFESKLLGMGVGGLGTWAVNGASFDYQGGQEFVGGALSAYVGMGKAVKGKHALFKKGTSGKAVFKKAAANEGFLYQHGDNFFKYAFQNTAYDFAYTSETSFKSRRGGHVELFLWGGLSGAFQINAWREERMLGTSLGFGLLDWGINGVIKDRYQGVYLGGSQPNKLGVNYFKWMLELFETFGNP